MPGKKNTVKISNLKPVNPNEKNPDVFQCDCEINGVKVPEIISVSGAKGALASSEVPNLAKLINEAFLKEVDKLKKEEAQDAQKSSGPTE